MLDIGETMETREKPPKEITLSEVVAMKVTCDAYFLSVFGRILDKEEQEHKTS